MNHTILFHHFKSNLKHISDVHHQLCRYYDTPFPIRLWRNHLIPRVNKLEYEPNRWLEYQFHGLNSCVFRFEGIAVNAYYDLDWKPTAASVWSLYFYLSRNHLMDKALDYAMFGSVFEKFVNSEPLIRLSSNYRTGAHYCLVDEISGEIAKLKEEI